MKYNLRVQARTGEAERQQTGGLTRENLNIINFVWRNDRKIVISWLIKAKGLERAERERLTTQPIPKPLHVFITCY